MHLYLLPKYWARAKHRDTHTHTHTITTNPHVNIDEKEMNLLSSSNQSEFRPLLKWSVHKLESRVQTPVFSSKRFCIVLDPFKMYIFDHLKLILCMAWGRVPTSFCVCVDIQSYQHQLLKRIFPEHWIFLIPISKVIKIHVSVNFWNLRSILLIYMPILILGPRSRGTVALQ